MDTKQPVRLPHLTDEQVVALMLQATGEDWNDSDAWKLRMFVHNASIDNAALTPSVAAHTDKRAAFEAWAKPRGYDLTRCSPVAYAAYKSDFTNGALAGWFGALESHRTLSTELVDRPVQSLDDAARDRDAARYRWLRQHRLFPSTSTFINAVELDTAIDAARKGAEK